MDMPPKRSVKKNTKSEEEKKPPVEPEAAVRITRSGAAKTVPVAKLVPVAISPPKKSPVQKHVVEEQPKKRGRRLKVVPEPPVKNDVTIPAESSEVINEKPKSVGRPARAARKQQTEETSQESNGSNEAEEDLLKKIDIRFQGPLEGVYSVLKARKLGKLTKPEELEIRGHLQVLMTCLVNETTDHSTEAPAIGHPPEKKESTPEPMEIPIQAKPAAGKKRKIVDEKVDKVVEAQPSKRAKIALDLPSASGILMTCGTDSAGELGLRTLGVQRRRPCPVDDVKEPVSLVAAGAMHTVAVSADGKKVFTFGCNDELALGRATVSNGDSNREIDPDATELIDQDVPEAIPAVIELPNRVVKVTAGDSHTAALTVNGALLVWGCFRVRLTKCLHYI